MPNIVTSPRFWERKALLAKIESAYGTDSVPTGAANWIEARNLSITPMDPETVDRNIDLPYMGYAGKVQVAQWAKVSFDVLIAAAAAAGDVPKVDPLLRACGFDPTNTPATNTVYAPVSTGFESASIYINIDGVRHQLVGARGTVGLKINSKEIPVFSFEFDAAFIDPADVAMPSVTTTGWPVEEAVNATNTTAVSIDAVELAHSAFEVNLGNQLARLSLPGPQVGVEITDRTPSGSCTVLAPTLAVFDPFTLAKDLSNVPLFLSHGSDAGNRVLINAQIVVNGVAYDQIETMTAYKLDFDLVPVSGNDELTILFGSV